MIFTFGSNLAGRHGAGAALTALRHHGAIYGCGVGHYGNSYALPTKDCLLRSLPLDEIAENVKTFLAYARSRPELEFQVTQIGCGLAGFAPSEIAPLFAHAPVNCKFDLAWRQWLGQGNHYWGTYS